MSYSSIDELPEFLRRTLPRDAQEIYREAYNLGLEREHRHQQQDASAVEGPPPLVMTTEPERST